VHTHVPQSSRQHIFHCNILQHTATHCNTYHRVAGSMRRETTAINSQSIRQRGRRHPTGNRYILYSRQKLKSNEPAENFAVLCANGTWKRGSRAAATLFEHFDFCGCGLSGPVWAGVCVRVRACMRACVYGCVCVSE